MSNKRKSFLKKRRWLNRDQSKRAYSIRGITVEPDNYRGKTTAWVAADFEIGDCTRSITLDFGSSGARERKEMMLKAEEFLRDVEEYVDTLRAAHEYAEEQEKKP